MSFTIEIYNLLIRYAKDYQGKTVTMEELQNRPWWKCVWGSWRAKAYYKIDNHYERLEDVPKGLTDYVIMTPNLKTHYFVFNRSEVVQEMSKEVCKSIYG